MCTLVLLLRPGHDWPLVLAANRDERLDRAADAPGVWWPDQPDVVGGRDRGAGGTWLAVRRDGMVAAVLNRSDSLGPAPGFASRGMLPLLALRAADAAAGARAVARAEGRFRGYNVVVADRTAAWFVRGCEGLPAAVVALAPGLHMVTARDPDDRGSARTGRHLPRLLAAEAPAPPDWSAWQSIMADQTGAAPSQINVAPIGGFGTVSASRVALAAGGGVVFQHAAGAPNRTGFVGVDMAPSLGGNGRGSARLL